MKYVINCLLIIVFSCLSLTGCDDFFSQEDKEIIETPIFSLYDFNHLQGWSNDSTGHSLLAFQHSCMRLKKKPLDAQHSRHVWTGTVADWLPLCTIAEKIDPNNHTKARDFYETHFNLYQVTTAKKNDGLFTGYYEPSLKGSLVATEKYHTPLYKRPADLVMVDLGDFREELKGQRIAGRITNAYLKPYEDRKKIDEGALDGQGLELVWVSDAIDAFFLHIQGSGRILLEDGTKMRVGYDGQNGHPYHAIGKTLIERGVLTKENVSLQSIKKWLVENKSNAQEILHLNPSYVFFKRLDNNDGPLGGEGVALTAGRSLAIDYTFLPYATPMFIQFENPLNPQENLARTMIAQDTGGAIRGVIRGDVFWGYGSKAETIAGQMKSKGYAWIMLPKTVPAPAQSLH